MYTNARFPSLFSLSFVWLALLSSHVLGFAYLAEENHEHRHEAFRRHVEAKLPNEEDRELYKRQLGSLLGAVTGSGGGDALGGLGGLVSAIPGLGGGSYTWNGGPLDVTGAYPFVPPGPGDARGPCPGLNAAANHGLLPHNGIVELFQVVNTINQLYGVGYELGLANGLLAVLAAGDPITMRWSLGGPSAEVGAPLGGFLGIFGQPQGLDYAHNFVEADCSLTRNDLFDTGDAWTLDIDLFKRWYYSVPEGQSFTFHDMAAYAARRFHECVATSPNFYFGPVSGLVVANAAKLFASRLMANYSNPYNAEGELTHEIIKSFFGIVDSPAPFTYNFGHEQIPCNWYRRPGTYGLLELNIDLIEWVGWYPELGNIGGNLGATNTFAGIRLDDPASGIANLPKLLEGNNLICIALELVKTGSPSFANNLFRSLFDLVATTVQSLGCPEVAALERGGVPLNTNLQSIYPGAAKAGSGL